MNDLGRGAYEYMQHVQFESPGVTCESRIACYRSRREILEMVGTHHPVGARVIVARRFWAVRGGEPTSGYGCEHATVYGRMAPLPFSSSKLVLAFHLVCELALGKSTPGSQ